MKRIGVGSHIGDSGVALIHQMVNKMGSHDPPRPCSRRGGRAPRGDADHQSAAGRHPHPPLRSPDGYTDAWEVITRQRESDAPDVRRDFILWRGPVYSCDLREQ
jgi:hypothetical protein